MSEHFDDDSFFDRALQAAKYDDVPFWARRTFWGTILLTASILIVATTIYMGVSGPTHDSDVIAPVIEADNTPVKRLPDDPGGRLLIDPENTIFNGRNNDIPDNVESLFATLPPVETSISETMTPDLDRSEPTDQLVISAPQKDKPNEKQNTNTLKTQTIPVIKPEKLSVEVRSGDIDELAETRSAPLIPLSDLYTPPIKPFIPMKQQKMAKAAPVNHTSKQPIPSSQSLDDILNRARYTEPAAASTPKISGKSKTIIPGVAENFVQLGSFKSREDASAHWQKLRSSNATLLNTLSPRIPAVDLGARGTYHRVQAGPVSYSKAQQICQSLNADRKGSCIVVR